MSYGGEGIGSYGDPICGEAGGNRQAMCSGEFKVEIPFCLKQKQLLTLTRDRKSGFLGYR